ESSVAGLVLRRRPAQLTPDPVVRPKAAWRQPARRVHAGPAPARPPDRGTARARPPRPDPAPAAVPAPPAPTVPRSPWRRAGHAGGARYCGGVLLGAGELVRA